MTQLSMKPSGMRHNSLSIVGLVFTAICISAAQAQQTLEHPIGEFVDMKLDSGALDWNAAESGVVYAETIRVERAGWMRLYFGEVSLPEGTLLRMTSLLDGEVQTLDAFDLDMWSHTSAYFNGDAVLLELVAGKATAGNRVAVDRVAVDGHGEDCL